MLLALTDTQAVQIAIQTLTITAKVSAPILTVSIAIGFGVSLLQSATQVQEFTLTFVPKLAGVALVIVVAGTWMLNELVTFTHQLFATIPSLVST